MRHTVSSDNLLVASVTGTSTTPELLVEEEEAVEENMQGNYSSVFLLFLYEGNITGSHIKVISCINLQM